MRKSPGGPLADRVIRCADRVRNAGNIALSQKGLRVAKKIRLQQDFREVERLEKEYALVVKKYYKKRWPIRGWILP